MTIKLTHQEHQQSTKLTPQVSILNILMFLQTSQGIKYRSISLRERNNRSNKKQLSFSYLCVKLSFPGVLVFQDVFINVNLVYTEGLQSKTYQIDKSTCEARELKYNLTIQRTDNFFGKYPQHFEEMKVLKLFHFIYCLQCHFCSEKIR